MSRANPFKSFCTLSEFQIPMRGNETLWSAYLVDFVGRFKSP